MISVKDDRTAMEQSGDVWNCTPVASATDNRLEASHAKTLACLSAWDLRLDLQRKGGPLATLTRKQSPTSRFTDALTRACSCARTAAENKGRNVLVLDMRKLTDIYDFMVVATGASRRQMHTIAEEVDDAMAAVGDRRVGIEGYESSKWIVQDYGDVVVHVFDTAARDFYALEELWADAPRIDWERQ
ncbi:MAG: ribosome silencing factor [Gemmataceae bacterium]